MFFYILKFLTSAFYIEKNSDAYFELCNLLTEPAEICVFFENDTSFHVNVNMNCCYKCLLSQIKAYYAPYINTNISRNKNYELFFANNMIRITINFLKENIDLKKYKNIFLFIYIFDGLYNNTLHIYKLEHTITCNMIRTIKNIYYMKNIVYSCDEKNCVIA